jgi:hypothetical protein
MTDKIRRALISALTVLALSGAIVAIEASPAAASYFDCPSGQAGVFADANGNGAHDCIAFSTHPVGQCFNFVSSFNDVASSVNVTFGGNHGLILYSTGGCGISNILESPLYVTPHSRADNLSGFYRAPAGNWNDVASSFSVY